MSVTLWPVLVCFCLWSTGAGEAQSQEPGGQRRAVVTSIQVPKEPPRTDVLATFPEVAQELVSKSAVPVLLLPNPREFETRRLVVKNLYYAAFFSDGKQSISVHGSRLAYKYPRQRYLPSKAERSQIRSGEGFVSESEGIWTASWKEFGASYFLSVECAEEKDDRCGSGKYVSQVANSLVYVGGGQMGTETQLPPLPEQSTNKENFSYNPPGHLIPGSGTGRDDDTVYAPGIRFPIENKPAYANSQVWNPGGKHGPPNGSQCDPKNYSYPWWDNFCETRSWTTTMCPTGNGHQGQDVRPSTCEKDKHITVSVSEGTVTGIGTYTVFITAADGTEFRYLHMSSVTVKVGDELKRGDRIGRVSNLYKSTTTIHLHFEILQHLDELGFVQVPPYMSLVRAYEGAF